MIAIAFALLTCTAYWIYVLITPPKGKRLSIIILLELDIIALLKIIFSNYAPLHALAARISHQTRRLSQNRQ